MILCTNHQVRVHACVERGVTPADRHPGLPQVAGSLLDGARLRWFRPKSCGQQSRAVGPAHEAPDPTDPRTSLRAKGSADPVEFAHRQRIRAFEDSVHRACSIAILAPRATPAATRRKPAANIDPRRRGCALSRLGGSPTPPAVTTTAAHRPHKKVRMVSMSILQPNRYDPNAK